VRNRRAQSQRTDPFAPLLVGNAYDRDVFDAGEATNRRRDGGGLDVLATGDNLVVDAADDPEAAALVPIAQVAGLEAAGTERGCSVGLVEIPGRDRRSVDDDFADVPVPRGSPDSSTILTVVPRSDVPTVPRCSNAVSGSAVATCEAVSVAP